MSVARELVNAVSALYEIAKKLEEEERTIKANKPIVENKIYRVVPDEREWITRKEACRMLSFPESAVSRIGLFVKDGLIKETLCFGGKIRRSEIYNFMDKWESGEIDKSKYMKEV